MPASPTPEDTTSEEPAQVEPAAGAPTVSRSEASDSAGLYYLKIVLALFAGIYTFFLLLDSIIIHRAQIRRENIPSSPHSLMMLLVSVVNFMTLWM